MWYNVQPIIIWKGGIPCEILVWYIHVGRGVGASPPPPKPLAHLRTCTYKEPPLCKSVASVLLYSLYYGLVGTWFVVIAKLSAT